MAASRLAVHEEMAGTGPAISVETSAARDAAAPITWRLLALRAEFLALRAMQALGVGLLRAFERLGGMRDGRGLGGGGGGRSRGLRESGAAHDRKADMAAEVTRVVIFMVKNLSGFE